MTQRTIPAMKRPAREPASKRGSVLRTSPRCLRGLIAGAIAAITVLDFVPTPAASTAYAEPAPPPQPTKPPGEVIRDLVDEAFAILTDKALKAQPAERMKRLRAVTDKVMDWDAMARSSIGHHWRTASEQQRAEFISIFKELLARQYRDDIDRFQGTEKVKFEGEKKSGELVTVHTTLTTASNEKVPIDYVLHKTPAHQWSVEDVKIENVSLVNHYRKTFDRFLVNQSFDALLARLKTKYGT